MRKHSLLALTALALTTLGSQAGLLQDRTRQSVNLNGEWQIHEGGGVAPSFPPPSGGWETAKVPGQGKHFTEVCGPYAPPVKDLLNKDKSALAATNNISQWYRRSFEMPAPAGRRALLRFEGAAFKSAVWLNGQKVSESMLGMVPQATDVTALAKPGANELLVWCGGRQTLIDVKSGKAVYPEMRYQTASYREALRIQGIDGVDLKQCRRGVLHIPREATGPARFHEHTRHQADFQGFLSCLYLFHDLKRGI